LLISWCKEAPYLYSITGDPHWQQPPTVSADVMIESDGSAFVAIGIQHQYNKQRTMAANCQYGIINLLNYGNVSVIPSTWNTLTLSVLSDHSEAYINGNFVGRCELNVSSSRGWVAIGSSWD
jgi:hypothetical protein